MASSYSIDEHKLDIIHQLSKATAFISDSKGLERHVVELLKKLVASNAVLTFRDNRERGYLVAANPYNLTQEEKDSLTIPHDDPVAQDILVHRKSLKRQAADDPILPLMNSELFVPLASPNRVFGCIYLSRISSKPFDSKDVKLVEKAATYLTIALERQQWEQQYNELERSNLLWQNHYIAILDALPFPAGVIEIKEDRFDEVNQRMLDLLQMQQHNFINERLSHIFKHPDWDTCRSALLELQTVTVQTTVAPGNTLSFEIRPVQLFEDTETKIFVYVADPEINIENTEYSWLGDFVQTITEASSDSLQVDVRTALESLLLRSSADYIVFQPTAGQLADSPNIMQRTEQDVTTSDSATSDALLSVIHELDAATQTHFIEDVQIRSKNKSSLGNVNSACISVQSGSIGRSTLGLFFKTQTVQSESLDILLKTCHSLLQQVLQKNHISGLLASVNAELTMQRSLKTGFSKSTTLLELIQNAVLELSNVVKFEYISIALLDDQGQQRTSVHVASKSLRTSIHDKATWTPIEASEFAIVEWPTVFKENSAALQDKPQRLPYTLPTHTSVLLMGNDQFLGNCAIGRSSTDGFSDDEMHSLRQFASMLAPEMQRLQKLDEMTDFARDMQAIQKLTIDHTLTDSIASFLKTIKRTADKQLDFDHFDLLPDSGLNRVNLFSWLPKDLVQQISGHKTEKLFQTLRGNKTSICIDTLETFVDMLMDDDADPDPLIGFKPFLLASIRCHNKTIAVLIISWGNRQYFVQYSDRLLETFANNLESALAAIDLNRKWKLKTEELESLIYAISHDLKTPIQSVRSFITMLTQEYGDYLPEEPQQFILRMMNNLDYMEKLIFDLLELSRVGKQGSERVNVDVTEILQSVIHSMQGLIKEHAISIDYDDLPTIQSDPTLLTHIFSNLLSNAFKYSKHRKHPKIKVEYAADEYAHQFTISDNGIGIAKEQHDRIFQVFQTEHKNDDDHSTGVGLAIVKQAVETLGGHIGVESETNNGAAFRFTVPKTD